MSRKLTFSTGHFGPQVLNWLGDVPITARHSCCVTSCRPSRNGRVISTSWITSSSWRPASEEPLPIVKRPALPPIGMPAWSPSAIVPAGQMHVLIRADVEAAEPSVGGDHRHLVAVAERVLLAHFVRHGDAEPIVEPERRGDDGPHRRLLDADLGLVDAAAGGSIRGASVREQIAVRLAVDHRRRRVLAVLEDPHAGPDALVFLAEREMKAALVARLQHTQPEDGIAQRAAHVAEVVPRAFLEDLRGPRHRVAGRLGEEAGQPLVVIADGHAVHRQHVAEREEGGLVVGRFDEQEVRPQIAMPHPRHVDQGGSQPGAAAAAGKCRDAAGPSVLV